MKSLFKSFAVVAALVALSSNAMADVITVTAPPATFNVAPSNDSLSFSNVNLNTTIGANVTTIGFQNFVFHILNTDPSPAEPIEFTLYEDVTINSITNNVALAFTLSVTPDKDVLTLAQGPLVQFGDVFSAF